MYYTFIYPYLIYVPPLLGSVPTCYVNSILVLKKRSIRAASKSSYLSRTDVICAKCGFVKIDMLFKYTVLQLMHKICYNNTSLCFT